MCTDCRALRAAVHTRGREDKFLVFFHRKDSNTAVLVLASTLHPSREELVQLPGFAGLDVPLLLVLEEREQLRIFHLGPVRIQLLMHLLAVLWIQWKARHLLRTAAGPRTIHIVNVVLATSQG